MASVSKKEKDLYKSLDKLYNKDNWKYDIEKKKWHTDLPWAGVAYEQGSFIEYILDNEKFKKDIIVLPYYVFNNNSCSDYKPETISTHLAGNFKTIKNITDQCEKKLKYKLHEKENFQNYNNYYYYNNYFISIIIIVIIIILILILILIIFLRGKNLSKTFLGKSINKKKL